MDMQFVRIMYYDEQNKQFVVDDVNLEEESSPESSSNQQENIQSSSL